MNLSLDSLIQEIELQNENCNDLLEIKTISLFFNQDQEDFKKYSAIQHKIQMNKSFESLLDLIQLMDTENMLINELAQFQYAIIELEKGNIENAQKIILSMNQKTIFYELSLIINSEIEDYINKNYEIFFLCFKTNMTNPYWCWPRWQILRLRTCCTSALCRTRKTSRSVHGPTGQLRPQPSSMRHCFENTNCTRLPYESGSL